MGDMGEADMALVTQIQEPARRGHDDVNATGQRGDLGMLRHTAEDDRLAQSQTRAVGAKIVMDLNGELARRCQHQGAWRMRPAPFS